jgi:hypothetical protein
VPKVFALRRFVSKAQKRKTVIVPGRKAVFVAPRKDVITAERDKA